MSENQVDLWIRELAEAGWEHVRGTIWRSPDGALYRGPYGAWKAMKEGSR